MVCAICGTANSEGARYCSQCGVMLGVPCPSCGASNNPLARRCGACGQPLRDLEPAATSGRAPLESKRIVTVLFADLEGYTSLVESYGDQAEQVRALLASYFQILSRVVREHGGTVEKFIGDAICALFGAPVVHEDDPARALRCALGMRDALADLNARRSEEEAGPLNIRIGVTTGQVVGGTTEHGGERQYSVTGDAVNTASRLQAAAGPGQIFVAASTEALARRAFRFESMGRIKLKGKRQPVETYRLLGVLRSEGDLALSEIVGREVETAHLMYCLGQAAAGTPQLVEVVGEPGIGKSAFVTAFAAQAREKAMVASSLCPPLGSMPFLPFQQISADLLQPVWPSASGEEEVSRPASQASVECLQALAAGTLVVGSEESVEQIASSLQELISQRSLTSTVVVSLEDVQRADPQSLDLWKRLLTSRWFGRVVLMWTRRTGEDLQLDAEPSVSFTRIVLGPLPAVNSSSLLDAIVDGVEVSDEVRKLVVERSGGNPLYIEAMTRSLLESPKVISGQEPLGSLEVPATVQGLIQSRLDSMPEPQRLLLQEAAVIGTEFDARLLERVDLFGIDVRAALEAVCRRGIVDQIGASSYRFRHVLTQEVAYNMMLEGLRSELHRETAEALLDLNPENVSLLGPTIADHYAKAGDVDRAVDILVQAGQQAT